MKYLDWIVTSVVIMIPLSILNVIGTMGIMSIVNLYFYAWSGATYFPTSDAFLLPVLTKVETIIIPLNSTWWFYQIVRCDHKGILTSKYTQDRA